MQFNRPIELEIILSVVLLVWTLSVTSEVTEESPVLQCVRRQYSYFATNNIRDGDDVYQCNGTVTVFSCWGRCDTHEIPDYRVPYKISVHPVCTYAGHYEHYVPLTNCDPRHPEPYAKVVSALSCSCSRCNPETTSCESLH